LEWWQKEFDNPTIRRLEIGKWKIGRLEQWNIGTMEYWNFEKP
jgi:predicted alpha/beta hydrolase family esterase